MVGIGTFAHLFVNMAFAHFWCFLQTQKGVMMPMMKFESMVRA
jgi:hypothetical protein